MPNLIKKLIKRNKKYFIIYYDVNTSQVKNNITIGLNNYIMCKM